ncbi:hypothetical protein N7504_009112 [Penicillium tannophilum]|nr:hypothetical protein N7504_009112 [Penicillium tannophilum]
MARRLLKSNDEKRGKTGLQSSERFSKGEEDEQETQCGSPGMEECGIVWSGEPWALVGGPLKGGNLP